MFYFKQRIMLFMDWEDNLRKLNLKMLGGHYNNKKVFVTYMEIKCFQLTKGEGLSVLKGFVLNVFPSYVFGHTGMKHFKCVCVSRLRRSMRSWGRGSEPTCQTTWPTPCASSTEVSDDVWLWSLVVISCVCLGSRLMFRCPSTPIHVLVLLPYCEFKGLVLEVEEHN